MQKQNILATAFINQACMHLNCVIVDLIKQKKHAQGNSYIVTCITMIVTISWQIAVNLPIISITVQKGT